MNQIFLKSFYYFKKQKNHLDNVVPDIQKRCDHHAEMLIEFKIRCFQNLHYIFIQNLTKFRFLGEAFIAELTISISV